MATTIAGSRYPQLCKAAAVNNNDDGDDDDEEEEEEDEDEEEADESGSTSSFSLQECINEFRARRIRRVSTQSRGEEPIDATAAAPIAADTHLINQNLCNKAQERRGKPCKNGFCYCFTSDSGDCASTAPPRAAWHVRQHKRSRRSESNKVGVAQPPPNNLNGQQRQQPVQSHRHKQPALIAGHTSIASSPLTAVSSLHAVGENAPLIHIIQELRDNCVISEVRVNREQLARASASNSTAAKLKVAAPKMRKTECIDYAPTAPVLSNISEQETPPEESEQALQTGGSLQSTRRSSRRSSSGAGGRLLQKRLSHGQVNFKTRDMELPPPKPPRRSSQSLDGKLSLSSLSSTTPSVRDAERVLDEFLRKHGVKLPATKLENLPKAKSKRKSYPLAEIEKAERIAPLPSCPSLSDIERVVESKRGAHYVKNIHMASRKSAVADKPLKEFTLGWTEPKINDMLNYDTAKRAQFKTHAAEPAPQVASNVGWLAPKISLDTVDGVSDNLAVNMQQKHTPIKYPRLPASKHSSSQKFIWGEQWRQLTPWSANGKRTGLRKKSKNFLNNSKKKILRFVSPKKSNQQQQQQRQDPELSERRRPTPRLCTVGVQTSASQLDLQSQSQSPPGSYHSPVQSTPTVSARQHQYKTSSEQPYFDFERKVKPPTPPKKLPRTQRPRKLNFQSADNNPATYRSFHKELDQDVTITKMGYLLGSIRAKLEASDERAQRTFRESSRYTPVEQTELPSDGIDCTDSSSNRLQRSATTTLRPRRDVHREPIYSEIEEDCMVISGSPQFDVRTEAQLEVAPTPTPTPTPTTSATVTATISEPTPVSSPLPYQKQPAADLNALYAQVQKAKKAALKPTTTPKTTAAPPKALGHFLQESLLNGSFFQFMPLPDEPSSDTSYTMSTSKSINDATEQATLPMHQSLNNINEQHSPPKKNRNLSKSELSLQRSEIFLENLCRSEMVLDHDDNLRLEKVQNTCLRANPAAAAADDVSYDMPIELYDDYVLEDGNASGSSFATNGQSQYGSVQLEPPPPSSDNQSTPKKQQQQRFTTKATRELCIDINDGPSVSGHAVSHSCPTTPQQQPPGNVKLAHSSLDELAQRPGNDSQLLSVSTLARYRLLKDAVRRSYRKGKDFLLAEKQRLTQSLSLSRNQANQTECELDSSSSYYASFNLDSLLNESLTTNEQLAQAVSICRQMPELEISAEMVEAERLLLFNTLQRKSAPLGLSEATLAARQQCQSLLLDGLHLPVKADVSQDMFFNYYYICTVECEGRIRSTQSIECQNGAAVFRDCGLEFYSSGPAEALELRCQIFMLRLRKVSTLSLEPAKTLLKRGSGSLGSGSSSSSSQCDQIVSRFRLHASFTLKAADLAPYELVASETQPSDKLWLRTSRTWQLPLTTHTKSTNLMPQIALSGRVELRLPKSQYAGYLNVQDTDPKNKHNWNRRWCTLDGLHLAVWQHEHNLSGEPPLLSMRLEECRQAQLDVAPRELCARARSFWLQCPNGEAFFATDTQAELVEWLRQLNETLAFARRWLSAS
ncbi:uncharacterized protein [Drosophila virilis]|uniref:PH domain-containing protein n=1 Tax=Drosophila virilis TaxID=7244 RepID=B4LN30_DROVI|nr:uncharacterized protein LOC6625580 [Drosophila virilis]EDW60034.2 uncharacterized protein Dvir_GJ21095 [Drosophila virilis]